MKEKKGKYATHKKKSEQMEIASDGIKLQKWLGLLVALFAFVLYAESISFSYTLDDTAVINNNRLVKEGISAIPTILTTDYLYGTPATIRGPQYRPASLVLFAIQWNFFPENPQVSHLVNVLLYALTCWLLFLLLCRLFKGQNLIFPFICALLFTAHPIHSEVVNSIKSADEILCFLFALLSMNYAIRSVENNSTKYIVYSSIFFFLSFLSKETAVGFLIMIPLSLYVFTQANRKQILSVFLALCAGGAVFLAIRAVVVTPLGDHQVYNAVMNNSLNAATNLLDQKATAFYVLLRYVGLLIFPHPLSYDYSFAQIPVFKINNPYVIFSVLLYGAMTVYAIIKIRQKSVIAFALLFYLIVLAPVSNVFLLIGSSMAERFLYIPSLGFCMLLTALLIKITKTDTIKSSFNSVSQLVFKNSVFAFVFVILAGYSIKLYSRNPDWKNSIALYTQDVNVVENSARAHYNLGVEILNELFPKESNIEKQKVLLSKSISELYKAVAIYPDYKDVFLTLARLYDNYSKMYDGLGQLELSLAYADSSIKYAPDISFIYNQKGVVLSKLNRFGEAIIEFNKCLKLDSTFVMAYKNIGICYLNLQQGELALFYLKKAQSMDPQDPRYTQLIENAGKLPGNTSKTP
jgi:tetratricopeptide (TPR) repeat protein